MRLFELYADHVDVVTDLRAAIMDVLIPIAASGVPYVGMDQVIQKLESVRSGVRITRDVVMDLLDPSKTPLVKSVNGDRIEFVAPSPIDHRENEDEAMKSQAKVQDMADKQLKKELKDK